MRHWICNILACVILGSAASLAAADVQSFGETDEDWAEAGGSALRPDAEAEAALRNAATAQEVMMGDYAVFGASEEGVDPGSGGGTEGAVLLGPLPAATVAEYGALLTAQDRKGERRGIGIELGQDIYLRADVNLGRDSHVIYARHLRSGRVYAWDADSREPWVCENDGWIGPNGIAAETVPVTAGRNDLDGVDCGGRQIRRWTRLSLVSPGDRSAHDEAAESTLRNARTAAEVLMADCAACGASEEGALPGSGRGGRGTELLGPLEQADYPEQSGALLSGRSRSGQPCGLGIDLPTGVYLRADASPGYDSYIIYARHGQSGRVYALDANDAGIFFCENDEWIGQSGILAAPVPVTAGQNDLDGRDCGGKQTSRWTRLSSEGRP